VTLHRESTGALHIPEHVKAGEFHVLTQAEIALIFS
jgi:hypothetical protein